MNAQAGLDADVIVVGAGAAGCVVARRLNEAGLAVLVVEAGPADAPPPESAGPVKGLAQADRQWSPLALDPTDPVSGHYWRGRGMGGGSAINGGVLMAGDRSDYRPYGGDELLGQIDQVVDQLQPKPVAHGWLSAAFRRAASHMGHSSASSSALPDQVGLLRCAVALDDAGRRSSAIFLDDRIEVIGGLEVDGLLRSGSAIGGVTGIESGGTRREFNARHVVLSMGALASPRLLFAEGLGNDQVGVGLKDHPAVPFTIEAHSPTETHDGGPISTGLRWSSVGGGEGDVLALPVDTIDPSTSGVGLGMVLTMVLRVESGGRITADRIDFGHLSAASDRARLRSALRHVAELLATAGMADRCLIDEAGTGLEDLPRSDGELDEWMRAHLGGVFHAACSARFGAAVGPGGVVLGARGISVIDASVLPDVPRSFTQLPVMAWASWLGQQLGAALAVTGSGQQPA